MDAKHFEAQVLRFARITVLALVGQLLVLGHWPGWSALWSLAVGAVETAVRQMYPTTSIYDMPTAPAPESTTPGGVGGQ